jgi:hypothetical protein
MGELIKAPSVDEGWKIMDKHGMTMMDSRLADALDDMPIGLEDLVEDDEEDEDE